VVEPDAKGLVDLDNLEKAVKKYKERPLKIGAFTACSNITGIQTPYHKMAAIMHENNGICFVDFAASAPYVSIDMHPEDPNEKLDGIFFSPHKFLGGPGTSGVMVFDSHLYSNKVPDAPGGGTVNWTNPWGGRSYISDIEAREDGGTPGFLQTIKTALSIQLKSKMNTENMLLREQEQLKIIFSEMAGIEGMHILAGDVHHRLSIVSFYVENVHYNLLVKIMNDRFGIQMRGGCSCAGTYGHYLLNIEPSQSNKITAFIDNGDLTQKPGWIRMSFHPIMTDEEVYYITDSLKKAIHNMSQWKDDYRYNLRTNEFSHVSFKGENQNMCEWFEF
jgi:selenocysteine lyase/cysteine desulfurase